MTGVIVHEWLAQTGGSENVFEAMSSIYPDARRYCLWNVSRGRFTGVTETWLARTPLKGRKAASVPLMPLAWRMLPAVEAEWVLVSSHVFAHHARFGGPARDAPKLVYAHTPARYVWVPELDGRGDSLPARLVSKALKPLDRARAQEASAIAANSRFVADRIAAAWECEATVVYPPVDVEFFAGYEALELVDEDRRLLDSLPAEFVFGASRLVAYKRLDLVIRVGQAADLPVVIGGEGPDGERLKTMAATASVPVRFVGSVSRALLAHLYARAAVVVFAPIEDFGIIPVEAMATGTPVIANAIGGAAESVIDGVTGAVVHDWTSAELQDAVATAVNIDPRVARARAAEFSSPVFAAALRSWMDLSMGRR